MRDLKDELKKRLNKDIDELVADLAEVPGPRPGFAGPGRLLRHFPWRGNVPLPALRRPAVDFTKPLALLMSGGSESVAVVAAVHVPGPAAWDITVKWCKKVDGYLREIAFRLRP